MVGWELDAENKTIWVEYLKLIISRQITEV